MMRTFSPFLALAALVVAGFSNVSLAGEPVVVTNCGQHVFGDAILTADLDCSSSPNGAPGIVLERSATLSLNGFTLTGGSGYSVLCMRSCKVQGPGLISGGAYGVDANRRVSVDGVTIENPENEAASSAGGSVRVANSTITNPGRGGVFSEKKVSLENVIMTGAGARIPDFAAAHGRRVDIVNSTITGCNFSGVDATVLSATNTQITGNGTNSECGVSLACTDIATHRRPQLTNSTCEYSLNLSNCSDCNYESPPPLHPETDFVWFNWGVCSQD